MQFLAKFVRGETAVGLFKRFVKDTLVSGCATLCVSLALSSLTRTVVPSTPPRAEAVKSVAVEPVQPLREPARQALFVGADQGRTLTAVAVGTGTLDAPTATTADSAAQKERPRRTAAPAPQPVQTAQAGPAARPVDPARIIRAVEVQPLAAPTVSAPFDLAVAAQRPEDKPQAGGRFGALRAAATFLRQSGEAVTTTASEVKDRVWGATGDVFSSVLR